MSNNLYEHEIILVDPKKLITNKFQNQYFNKTYLETKKQGQFYTSVKKHGIQTPLKITRDYMIIGGHKRRDCAKAQSLKVVPCQMCTRILSDDELELHTIEDNYFNNDMSSSQKSKAYNRLYALVRTQYQQYVQDNKYESVKLDGLSEILKTEPNLHDKVGLVLSSKELMKLEAIKQRNNRSFAIDVEEQPDAVKNILINKIGVDKPIADNIIQRQKTINTKLKNEQGKGSPEYYLQRMKYLLPDFQLFWKSMGKNNQRTILPEIEKILYKNAKKK